MKTALNTHGAVRIGEYHAVTQDMKNGIGVKERARGRAEGEWQMSELVGTSREGRGS